MFTDASSWISGADGCNCPHCSPAFFWAWDTQGGSWNGSSGYEFSCVASTTSSECADANRLDDSLGRAGFFLGFANYFISLVLSASQTRSLVILSLATLLLGLLATLLLAGMALWLISARRSCFASLGRVSCFVVALLNLACILVVVCYRLHRQFDMRTRLELVEADLPKRIRDGSLRLLRVDWLLQTAAADRSYRLQRRQDLETQFGQAALWSPDEALSLLRKGKVAALSYRWLERLHPDPERFHLDAVLAFFREGDHAQRHTALMIVRVWRLDARPRL
jgi:hypothetical protein